ncbi:MAG: Guanylate kinase [Chlamydiae bacterium]|nr:Guanylate kinase [Chlamydiota bacterium]
MSEKLLGTLSKGLLIVISAPAGTGKTTLVRMLTDEFSCVSESISCTTRPIRQKEIADKDYHFLSEEEFKKKVVEGKFLEHAEVFGNYYGTLRSHIDEKLGEKKHVILVIDTQGAMDLKEKEVDGVYIFVRPPSLAELRQRLFKRASDKPEEIENRLTWAKNEIEMSRHYDYTILNDNLHRAYEILRSILIAEEHKKERYDERILDE